MRRDLVTAAGSEDPLFFTLAPIPGRRPLGVASYMRITPEHGVIEIGNIWFGPALQHTSAATRRSTCSLGTLSMISATAAWSRSATRSTLPPDVPLSG